MNFRDKGKRDKKTKIEKKNETEGMRERAIYWVTPQIYKLEMGQVEVRSFRLSQPHIPLLELCSAKMQC